MADEKKKSLADRIYRLPEVPGMKPGAPSLSAEGAKRIRPGDGNSTSARTVSAYETKMMSMDKDRKNGLVDPQKLGDMKRFMKQKNI